MSIEPIKILRRLESIETDLNDLKGFEEVSLEEYLNDRFFKLLSERLLERILQAAIDINDHILTEVFSAEIPQKGRNQNLFLQMGERNIIDSQLSEDLAKTAIVRNLIAHRFLEINYQLMFGHIKSALKYYPTYVKQIRDYVNLLRERD